VAEWIEQSASPQSTASIPLAKEVCRIRSGGGSCSDYTDKDGAKVHSEFDKSGVIQSLDTNYGGLASEHILYHNGIQQSADLVIEASDKPAFEFARGGNIVPTTQDESTTLTFKYKKGASEHIVFYPHGELRTIDINYRDWGSEHGEFDLQGFHTTQDKVFFGDGVEHRKYYGKGRLHFSEFDSASGGIDINEFYRNGRQKSQIWKESDGSYQIGTISPQGKVSISGCYKGSKCPPFKATVK
jgi:hypothetical protein